MAKHWKLVKEPEDGNHGPGTSNSRMAWSATWPSQNRPGRRSGSLSYHTIVGAEHEALKAIKRGVAIEDIEIHGRWCGMLLGLGM